MRWSADPAAGGPHLVDDAHAIADCRITGTVSACDHTVVFGEVFRVEHLTGDDRSPLLYGLRQYSSWSVV